MKEIVYYPACADRRPIDHNYIRKEHPFSTFEEAMSFELGFFHDDDDYGVIAQMGDVWFRVWKRLPTGELMVSDEIGLKSGWCDALPLSKYIKCKNI